LAVPEVVVEVGMEVFAYAIEAVDLVKDLEFSYTCFRAKAKALGEFGSSSGTFAQCKHVGVGDGDWA
jgi:hypothetical protein